MKETKDRDQQLYELWENEMYNKGPSEWRNQLTDVERCMVSCWDGDFYDAHSCREHADVWGYCMQCGRIFPGTNADYSEHGFDPPETP